MWPWNFKKTAIFLGNTVGKFIPWTCSKGHSNTVSDYNGNIVDGYSCPKCAAIHRQQRIEKEQQQRREQKHRDELAQKQKQINQLEERQRKKNEELAQKEKEINQSQERQRKKNEELAQKEKEINQSQEKQRKKNEECIQTKKELQISKNKERILSNGQQMLSGIIKEDLKLNGISVQKDCIKMNLLDETNKFTKEKLQKQKITHDMYKQILKKQNGEYSFGIAEKNQKTINITIPLTEQEENKEFRPNILMENNALDHIFQLQMARQALKMKSKK